MLTMFATALATTLLPASLPVSVGATAENAHHSFRLPADLAHPLDSPANSLTGTPSKVCPSTDVVTVCANRSSMNLQFRVPASDNSANSAAGPHLRSLRIQPSRCVNPVEEGLRCIRPVPSARIALGN
ncbi:MAG: hypothetical protein ACK4Z8_04925 [Novosphingobium sp.]